MSNTVFEMAKARQKAVGELKLLREQQNALLLDGTSNLHEAVRKYEGELIRFALRDNDKCVAKAAVMLNIHRQTLATIIETRHQELMSERSPVHHRKRSSNV